MDTGALAAVAAALVVAFVEAVGRFYPSRRLWRRLRGLHGRRAVRSMRERFEAAARRNTGRVLALGLAGLFGLWVAFTGLLEGKWYETALQVLPYLLVGFALLRLPVALGKVAERMREYERSVGEDPDRDLDDSSDLRPGSGQGGSTAWPL